MEPKKITTKNFVINSSRGTRGSIDPDFVWFVRHPVLNGGKPIVVKRGSLEHALTELRKEVK